ncbi:hypothetical protein C1H76_2740 [Elsinoe australis]|uniref:Uncharacterized protein n=1 Tax=Elsinoe australis TaxID=40998 RepID=A0A4U7B6T9_9PEZI|nr:hypothetical protein C1H76_2740 [Elsinoe australis]
MMSGHATKTGADGMSIVSTAVASEYAPSLASTIVPEDNSPFRPSKGQFKLFYDPSDKYSVSSGDAIEYVIDMKATREPQAKVVLYEGSSTQGTILAAATWELTSKHIQICWGKPGQRDWHGALGNWNHLARTVAAPGGGRKLKCERLVGEAGQSNKHHDQTLYDATTKELLGGLGWACSEESAGHTSEFHWNSPLTKHEEIAALIVMLATEKKMRSAEET